MLSHKEVFKSVPTDPDTEIYLSSYTQIESVPLILQTWSWGGIFATSAIIPETNLEAQSDEMVLELLKRGKLNIQHPFTIVRNRNGFCFVNFEFLI